jgi:hypothetical protein
VIRAAMILLYLQFLRGDVQHLDDEYESGVGRDEPASTSGAYTQRKLLGEKWKYLGERLTVGHVGWDGKLASLANTHSR